MPDLQTNASLIDQNKNAGGGLGGLSLPDLLKLVGSAREIQTQQAESDATKANPDDPMAAWKALTQNPQAYVTPRMQSHFAGAAQDVLQTRQAQMGAGAKLVSSVLDLDNPSAADFDRIAPALAGLKIPPDILTSIITGPKDGPEFVKNLQLLRNVFVNNSGAEAGMTGVPGPGGTTNVTGGRAALINRGVAGASNQGIAGGGNQGVYDQESAAANSYKERVQPLEQAIPALDRLGKAGIGPGTSELNAVKTFLISLPPDMQKAIGADKIDINKITDYTEAEKYLKAYANAASSGGTNDRMAQTIASNPNMSMAQAPAALIAKVTLGTERMRMAQYQQFQEEANQHPGDPRYQPAAFPQWKAAHAKDQDPRAYVFDMMPKEAQVKLLNSMSAKDLDRFEASLGLAEKYQLNSPRGGWNVQ